MKSSEESIRVELAKLKKIFSIITMLKTGCWTTKQLCERADISRRSWFRYQNLLSEIGFCIKRDTLDRYRIITTTPDPIDVRFSIEELHELRPILLAHGEKPLYSSMLKKLSLLSELNIIPEMFHKAHLGILVEQLSAAIRNQQQVIAKRYHSANSNTIEDRPMEPIHFCDNYGTIVALDPRDQKIKHFKLERMTAIEETRFKFLYTDLHEIRTPDAFGFNGTASAIVTLKLKMRAYLLLREEFPMAVSYITEKDGEYIFEGPVASYAGIGRFVIGLSREVEIVGPKEFDDYVINETMDFIRRKQVIVN